MQTNNAPIPSLKPEQPMDDETLRATVKEAINPELATRLCSFGYEEKEIKRKVVFINFRKQERIAQLLAPYIGVISQFGKGDPLEIIGNIISEAPAVAREIVSLAFDVPEEFLLEECDLDQILPACITVVAKLKESKALGELWRLVGRKR